MARFGFHRINRDPEMIKLYKRTFGPYFFKPCECGCTRQYGVGFQLRWFGIKMYL